MFSFLGLRKDTKKPSSSSSSAEKESDGGFVIVGETFEEQRKKIQSMNLTQSSSYVVVQPSKSSCRPPAQLPDSNVPAASSPALVPGSLTTDPVSALPDLLGDVPFTLAPHVQAVQAGFPLIPDVLLARDLNYNLASFQYDFSLENSVLHNA